MRSGILKKIIWGIFSMSLGMGVSFLIVESGSPVQASFLNKTATEKTSQEIEIIPNVIRETVTPPTVPSTPVATPEATGYANEEAVVAKKIVSSCPKPTIDFPDYSSMNVGQTIALPYSTYVPTDLIELPKTAALNAGLCLKKEAAAKLEGMIAEAKRAGLSIRATSAFRSFDTQSAILNKWVLIRGDEAYTRVAKPGYSEHQLGVTVDVSGSSIDYISAAERFGNSPEVIWLKENAFSYGFVMSYPKGKEAITGYIYEPWHYRYVGVADATEIKNQNITLTEFLAQKEKSL